MCNKELKYSDIKTENSKYYSYGKYFDSSDEMLAYCRKWPDLPLDIEEFERQMQMRIDEAKLNFQCSRGRWTNRDAYKLLRMHTDWVEEKNV